MRPIKTHESNFTYLGPTPEVADLPCRTEGDDTFSVWELDEDERAMLAAGGHVRMGIHGVRPIPPVSLNIVANAGPYECVTAPCDVCGKDGTDPVHGVGAGTHAYRSRGASNRKPYGPQKFA